MAITQLTERPLPRATLGETLAVLSDVLLPNLAKGVILRRPKMVAIAERMDLDRRAVERLQELRNKYGKGPLMLRIPGREQAVVLDPGHVRRVLDESPDPFATASSEKRSALAHFEPKGALISDPPERSGRRHFNDEVLESGTPMHRLADKFVSVLEEETTELLKVVDRSDGRLGWEGFIEAWFRVVRRVVFGDGARDDRELREMVNRLRADANWAFLRPKRHDLRKRFYHRMNEHLARAEPGSLASIIAAMPTSRTMAIDHQVPQWLFAFDPAGMTTFRTLALLATHPTKAQAARVEIDARDGFDLPFLRACVLESLRLWPTTPMILRQTHGATSWETGVMPADAGVLLFAPFFHRDDQRLTYANRFAPEVWLDADQQDQGQPADNWPLIPFSDGPGICPGRNLVLLLASNMVALLLGERSIELERSAKLNPEKLPGTLNVFSLNFRLQA